MNSLEIKESDELNYLLRKLFREQLIQDDYEILSPDFISYFTDRYEFYETFSIWKEMIEKSQNESKPIFIVEDNGIKFYFVDDFISIKNRMEKYL